MTEPKFDPEMDMIREEVSVIRLDMLRWSQQEFADALGIARTTVARWETGALPLTRVHALAIRQLLAIEKKRRAAKAKTQNSPLTGRGREGLRKR